MILVAEDPYDGGGLGNAVLNAVATHSVQVHKLAVIDVLRSGARRTP